MIPLVRVASGDAWDEQQPELWAAAHAVLDDPGLVRRTFEILGELVDNSTTHGHSAIGTFVCAQRYTGHENGLQAGVWLGVVDGGPGIPAHLRSNPRYRAVEDDEQLIRLCRRPWVTGTRDRRGWGLVDVFEDAAKAGPGEVMIRSGRGQGFFRLHSMVAPYARYAALQPAVPGAWIHLVLDRGT